MIHYPVKIYLFSFYHKAIPFFFHVTFFHLRNSKCFKKDTVVLSTVKKIEWRRRWTDSISVSPSRADTGARELGNLNFSEVVQGFTHSKTVPVMG